MHGEIKGIEPVQIEFDCDRRPKSITVQCMKTEVYSWRVSKNLKTDLEREARRRHVPLSAILETATREWLTKNSAGNKEEEEQQMLHQSASEYFGALASGNSRRSEIVRQDVGQRLQQRQALALANPFGSFFVP